MKCRKWKFTFLTAVAVLLTSNLQQAQAQLGPFKLVSKNSDLVLDLPLPDKQHTYIQQYSWNGGKNQKWYLDYGPNGVFFIRSAHNGKVLDVPGGATQPIDVQSFVRNGETHQQWILEPQGNECYVIRNVRSRLVLDVKGASKSWGARVQQFPSYNPPADNQRWCVRLPSLPPLPIFQFQTSKGLTRWAWQDVFGR